MRQNALPSSLYICIYVTASIFERSQSEVLTGDASKIMILPEGYRDFLTFQGKQAQLGISLKNFLGLGGLYVPV
jgi:hypothetical protein